MGQMQAHHDALIEALVAEVERRTRRRKLPAEPQVDWPAHVLERLSPMVHGLLPAAIREAALAKLVPGVKLVTPGTIASVLREAHWTHDAWNVANIYLDAVGAKPLDGEGWAPLGWPQGMSASCRSTTSRAPGASTTSSSTRPLTC